MFTVFISFYILPPICNVQRERSDMCEVMASKNYPSITYSELSSVDLHVLLLRYRMLHKLLQCHGNILVSGILLD